MRYKTEKLEVLVTLEEMRKLLEMCATARLSMASVVGGIISDYLSKVDLLDLMEKNDGDPRYQLYGKE